MWGKILTMDKLMRRGYALTGWCCMCCGNGKLVDHLLPHWKAVGLWNFVFRWSGFYQDESRTSYLLGGIGLETCFFYMEHGPCMFVVDNLDRTQSVYF